VVKVTGVQLSAFGRSALSNVGKAGADQKRALDPVQETDPLKDPTSSEYKELQELKQRDREVRQHEQAHIAAGGAYVRGGASFSYQRGADGRQYAVGGEVQIDTSEIPGDPAATIRKMQVVRSAAMAPAEPSGQDRAVAAEATQAEAQARADLREQQSSERDERTGNQADAAGNPAERRGRRNSAIQAYASASATADPGSRQQAEALLDLTA
jgi:hypothetical protein